MSVTPSFTLVSTVFNEANRLESTIQDLEHQTLKPSEIIITDAGSTDGTFEQLQQWRNTSLIPIVILQKIGCNVAEGRNMAIRQASNKLIASTDFGCRFHPGWLESIITPFKDPDIKAVGGGFTVLEEDIDTVPAKAAYLLFAGYKDNIHEPWFTPTSRSIAYRKEVFDSVGGYCEWLTLAADDTIFGRLVKKKGFTFYMVDEPYVYWGRHKTAKGYGKEAFRYGLGDGESHINKKSAVSSICEAIARYLLILILFILLLSIPFDIPGHYFIILFPLLIGLRSYINYTKTWQKLKSKKYNYRVYLYGFYLLELTRINYFIGYYTGYYRSPEFRKIEAKKLSQELAV